MSKKTVSTPFGAIILEQRSDGEISNPPPGYKEPLKNGIRKLNNCDCFVRGDRILLDTHYYASPARQNKTLIDLIGPDFIATHGNKTLALRQVLVAASNAWAAQNVGPARMPSK